MAFGLRFWRLDRSPASMYIDEIDLGYQARSLLTTGKDYRGGNGLVVARSFNADRLPMSIWGAMMTTAIFDNPYYQVRGASALVGVGVVIFVGVLVWLWTKNITSVLSVTAVFAVSPWMIQFSRLGFEGVYELLMLLIALVGWQLYINKKVWGFYLFVLASGMSLYTYRSMTLLVPIIGIIVFVVYGKEIWDLGVRRLAVGCVIFLMLAIPHYWKTVIRPSDELRINQISIFSDPLIPIGVIRNRELASGDYLTDEIGRSPTFWSKLIYNKPVSYLDAFINNYLKAWSFDFLFVSGDPNPRHAAGKMGMLYSFDVIGLLSGALFLFLNWKKKFVRFLSLILICAPLGSVITEGGGTHAHRLLVFGMLLLVVVGLGWSQLFEKIGKWGFVPLVLYMGFVAFYVAKYQVNYPYESFRSFGYGYKEAVVEIKKIEDNFKKVQMTQSIDPPIFYYLFWNNVDPVEVIEYGTNFSDSIVKKQRLDKYRALEWPEGIRFATTILEPDTLYLLTQRELPFDLREEKNLPEGIKLWKVILYPDGTPAFYIISRM